VSVGGAPTSPFPERVHIARAMLAKRV
jgi:hypothetical protein